MGEDKGAAGEQAGHGVEVVIAFGTDRCCGQPAAGAAKHGHARCVAVDTDGVRLPEGRLYAQTVAGSFSRQ